ncbi:hypothetical protein M501DRAFT_1001972 [Patellaria atrata CBS 101060]|uniref:Myb-like transcription factor n=1 Tax=Patellaria atrata CBS 101060 TaxID=1346257 RepID=A0A9P4VSY2_9PEZI|nr:hypothetical protein M501DRAFT_1001972 [Patellaria atrata CBS 101060]
MPMTASPSQLNISAADPTTLHGMNHQMDPFGSYHPAQAPPPIPAASQASTNPRKRRASEQHLMQNPTMAGSASAATGYADPGGLVSGGAPADIETPTQPVAKKGRTNTPWTPAEEQRLKQMRDAGNSWSEIAKTFPTRTEGSVKKHWYKDMHYAEFAEDESAALLAAIKEYEASKWKVIGAKVGKPAKACEQYAKEHFGGKI